MSVTLAKEIQVNNDTDVLQVQNVNEKGYGSIYKLVMKDTRLTVQAKGIYSYFCSYAGNGTIAFPKVETVIYDLQMSKNSYYKHFKLLKEYGYIKTEQQHKNGRLSHNIYTIMKIVPKNNEAHSSQASKNDETEATKKVINSK